jgi:mycofactocin system glycosyltransferase
VSEPPRGVSQPPRGVSDPPAGPLALDRSARVIDGGRAILGGDPPRLLTLTETGARALQALAAGLPPDTRAREILARRLLAAGLAHPLAPSAAAAAAAAAAVTVVVPVRDRATALDRCLTALAQPRVIVVDDGSADPSAVAAVAARHGARLVRRERSGGPAAARNAALAHIDTELVAFLDSDCVPHAGWLSPLCGHLAADPGLGAVAPRVRASTALARRPAIARFAAARSPLDLGPHPALVRPGGRVAYLPTAALVCRRAALGAGFDEALRHGEDVDLVWRMGDAGWRLRYEPAAVVGHEEPNTLRGLLGRRYRYGTSAGPLARRHPGRLAPLVLHARPLAVAGRLRGAGVPPALVASLAARDLAETVVATGRTATMLAPGLLAAGVAGRRTRPLALGLLAAEPLRAWARARPRLDPVRFAALAVVDDVAYGAGVWAGALRARTARPLIPRVITTRSGGPATDPDLYPPRAGDDHSVLRPLRDPRRLVVGHRRRVARVLPPAGQAPPS